MGLRLCCCLCPENSNRQGRRSVERRYDDSHSYERKSLRENTHLSYSFPFPKDFQYDSHPPSTARIPDPLTTFNWYYGTISRFQAQELLKNEENGVFLVRKCSDLKSEYPYIISVKQTVPEGSDAKENYHYRIRKDDGGYFTLGSNLYFKTVMDLVEFYKGKPDLLKVTLTAYIDHTHPKW